jgi:hypothetical protein|tara:strand:- start:2458 stop:2730 length:273 start_codon:yes stop_codon:yes gene_type:complete
MSSESDYIRPFKEDLIPVEGREGWYRDPDSNAIVNCNVSEYDNYMAAYNRRENKEKKLTTLQDEVSELKSDIGEIKNLLKSLLQGDKNAS